MTAEFAMTLFLLVLVVTAAFKIVADRRADRARRERETRLQRLVVSGVLTGLTRGGGGRRR